MLPSVAPAPGDDELSGEETEGVGIEETQPGVDVERYERQMALAGPVDGDPDDYDYRLWLLIVLESLVSL